MIFCTLSNPRRRRTQQLPARNESLEVDDHGPRLAACVIGDLDLAGLDDEKLGLAVANGEEYFAVAEELAKSSSVCPQMVASFCHLQFC
jgi:hypothetical protein